MEQVVGVILAGGQGSRMRYRNKPLLPLNGRALIEHVMALAGPQVKRLVLSVTASQAAYRYLELPLIPDVTAARSGPLVGICSAMQWYHDRGQLDGYLACFPADVPVFPNNLVATLLDALQSPPARESETTLSPDTVAWCQTGEQVQPLFSLWPMVALPRLRAAISSGIHGPMLYFRQNPNLPVLLPAAHPPWFSNINTPEQLAEVEHLITAPGSQY